MIKRRSVARLVLVALGTAVPTMSQQIEVECFQRHPHLWFDGERQALPGTHIRSLVHDVHPAEPELLVQAVGEGLAGGMNTAPPAGWKLVWRDEFEGDALDETKWSRCKRGKSDWNNTMSTDPGLVAIEDGILRLKGIVNADREKDSAPFLTAGITSRHKYAFKYGKVQIRARFKSAQGAWPALWMMGKERGWPANGEIDLMEHLNFDNQVHQTVHSEYTVKIDKTNTPPKSGTATIKRDAWNTYGCEWDENRIVFTVNGLPTHTYPRVPEKGEKQWPFNQPFYLILSMQVGGGWVNGSGPTNPEHFPAWMDIDWVRVFRAQ